MNKQVALTKCEICRCPSFRMVIDFCCSSLWFLLLSWVDQDTSFLRSICCRLPSRCCIHLLLVLRSLGDGGDACRLGRVPPCLLPLRLSVPLLVSKAGLASSVIGREAHGPSWLTGMEFLRWTFKVTANIS